MTLCCGRTLVTELAITLAVTCSNLLMLNISIAHKDIHRCLGVCAVCVCEPLAQNGHGSKTGGRNYLAICLLTYSDSKMAS